MVSSYKNMSKSIFEEMGRRKFRLSVHRKNEERRKAAPALRRVSVPSDLITAVPVGSMTIQSSKADLHPVVENQRMEDTGPFLVSFPLSVFMLSEVHTLDVLLSRLAMTTLPSMWVILDGLPLFVCRMHSTQLQPTVLKLQLSYNGLQLSWTRWLRLSSSLNLVKSHLPSQLLHSSAGLSKS